MYSFFFMMIKNNKIIIIIIIIIKLSINEFIILLYKVFIYFVCSFIFQK